MSKENPEVGDIFFSNQWGENHDSAGHEFGHKYTPSTRKWHLNSFFDFCRRKKITKRFIELTSGVYRYEPLSIDCYPSNLWAKNYKTGEKMQIEYALELILKHIKQEQENEFI